MKKIFSAFICALFLCVTAVCASAADSRFVDSANLVDNDSSVAAALDKVSAEHGVDVVVVTVDNYSGSDPERAAKQLYNDGGYSSDGVILMLSTADRERAIWATEGKAREALNSDARERVFSNIKSDLSADRYEQAFKGFASGCDDMLQRAEDGKPYKKPMSILCVPIALLIGLVAAFIGTGSMKAQLRSVAVQKAANNYVKQGSFNVTYSRDIFLYQTLETRHIETSSDSSSGSDDGGSHGHY